jgi:signal transduction histidine kinase
MNRVFDRAIAVALKAYSDQRAAEVKARRDEYLAFVAHDLRTPLSAISLAGRVLERTLLDPSANAESARMLGALRRNVQQLEVLVRKVLEESSAVGDDATVNLQRRDFYLWPLVEALIEDLRVVSQASSTRVLNQVPDDLLVYADASLLRRILQNLIANAIKHTPRGEVSIGAAPDEAGGGVVCWVRDDGSGIAEAQLGNIFAKGETDSPGSGATGLGLAIVKTFTEAHGGVVTVESTPGQGSTFRLTLPGASRA